MVFYVLSLYSYCLVGVFHMPVTVFKGCVWNGFVGFVFVLCCFVIIVAASRLAWLEQVMWPRISRPTNRGAFAYYFLHIFSGDIEVAVNIVVHRPFI